MNILLANWTWYPSGGDWTYIDSICKLYESHGHKIIPFSVHNVNNFPTPYEKYFLDGIDYKKYYKGITPKSLLELFSKSIYSVEAKKKLRLLLDENSIDIVQLNNINNYHTPSIIPVLKKRKIPVVWRILDYKLICPNNTFIQNDKVCEACYKHKYYNCILKKCKKNSLFASTLMAFESYFYYLLPFYKHVDMFLFQSEFTRDMFVKYGFDIKKTHIIENPYNCENTQTKFEGRNYILYFGRISREKGIFTLINAMKSLPGIELKVIGDGPEFQYYTKYITENSISNVSLIGPKWDKELEPYIKDCEFVVIPSEWYEPSPYVALQSFSYGKPVIASNMGGLNDLVVPKMNGLLFNAGDKDNLSQTIAELMRDKSLIQKMGMNARSLLERKHSPERYYADTINIFSGLINK
jgi:glycosyltransferase involved in cell wall biosynthesis